MTDPSIERAANWIGMLALMIPIALVLIALGVRIALAIVRGEEFF